MAGWLESSLALLPAFEALAVLTLRSAALVALGWLGATLLRRSLPSARQALWTAVIVGLVVLPILTATLPAWRILPLSLGTQPVATPAVGASGDWRSELVLPGVEPAPVPSAPPLEWTEWLVLLWAGGALVAALVFATGLWRLRRVHRAGRPASATLRRLARGVAEDFGVRRPVRVLTSSRIVSPATWGFRRPLIVVPPTAAGWSAARCRLVLTHEMAHVARGDWCWRLLAQLGCVIYWFNPFAWIAARRLRFEQELACDLAVVERGARPSLYADHLLNIARAAAQGRALPLAALDMARRSQMEGRLMSILADRPARRFRRGLLLPALSIVAALPVVAAIQPQAPPVPEEAPEAPGVLSAAEPAAPPAAPPATLAQVVARPSVAPAPEAPAMAGVPAPSPFLQPVVPSVGKVSHVPRASAVPAPVVAPSTAAAPEPVLAPVAPVAAGSVYGVLAASEVVAPVAAVAAVPAAPEAPALAPVDRAREVELEARIAAKAAEIEALVGPIHEEIERAMEETMTPMLEQMELLELEMRPVHEELSRIGEEMSQRLMESMPAQLEIEEHARRVEAIALEMQERSQLTGEMMAGREFDQEALNESVREMNESLAPLHEQLAALHLEMRERRRSANDMRELMEPYREQMEALRESLAPQRERMEELRRQFEPRREEMDRVRKERMADVRARLATLRAELRELSRERARAARPEDLDER